MVPGLLAKPSTKETESPCSLHSKVSPKQLEPDTHTLGLWGEVAGPGLLPTATGHPALSVYLIRARRSIPIKMEVGGKEDHIPLPKPGTGGFKS